MNCLGVVPETSISDNLSSYFLDFTELNDTSMAEGEATAAGTPEESGATVSLAELTALIDARIAAGVERALTARSQTSGEADQPPLGTMPQTSGEADQPPLGTMPPAEALQGMPVVSTAGPVSVSLSHVIPFSGTPVMSPTVAPSVNPTTIIPCTIASTPPPGNFGGASMLCNLLPTVGQPSEGSLSAGIYVGEGLLPVPAKLAEKITRWEFVEMSELLPEFWSSLSTKDPSSSQVGRQCGPRRKRAVTDIATWIQSFSTYTSVMSTAHPRAVPELLAYLIFILRASQDFGGVAWVTYDSAFRRQAFITGNKQWSRVNPSLYSICFA